MRTKRLELLYLSALASKARPIDAVAVTAATANVQQVFVYETLLNNKLLTKVLKRPVDTIADKLMGYREISMESKQGKNYHTIIPDVNDYVLGKRFSATPQDLKLLDKWENEYARKRVRLVSEQVVWP